MQALHKGATIYIADFKGAVDFSKAWRTHDRCCIITEEAELLELLTSLVDELETRKELLRKTDCANIDKYNEYLDINKGTHEERLNRIIFACDEIGELLDKTGLPKDEKEIISRIESKLSTIARQGRAFGIHLVLATQRPDANVLNGQIKNNLDVRIAGRCDNVLSQIILDNTDAADLPKDISGRFILGDGTVFQAFSFSDDDI